MFLPLSILGYLLVPTLIGALIAASLEVVIAGRLVSNEEARADALKSLS